MQVGDKITSCNCYLRVASCFLGVSNLRNLFYEFQIAFYELQLLKIIFYELPPGFYVLEVSDDNVCELRSCLLQFDYLRYHLNELPSHVCIKFEGNKSSSTVWIGYFNEMRFYARYLEHSIAERHWNRYKGIWSVELFQL